MHPCLIEVHWNLFSPPLLRSWRPLNGCTTSVQQMLRMPSYGLIRSRAASQMHEVFSFYITSHCRETHCAISRTIVKPSVPVENPEDYRETAPEQWPTKTLPRSLVCGAALTASHYLHSKAWPWASVQVIGEHDVMHYSDICWTNSYMPLRQSNSTNL